MNNSGNIKDVIKLICELLKISKPEIVVSSELPTDTLFACFFPETNKIFVKSNTFTPDSLFAIAHELRHKYQFVKCPEILSGYKVRTEFINIDDYNKQFAEIDANAFAMFFMENFYDLSPTFDSLSDETYNLICKRCDEIEEEFGPLFS